MRDLKGYGRTPPHANWPGGARVAVSFVINFEEGAEMSLSAGDAFNEKVYEVTDEVVGVADRCMESHFEYGTRAAWWRIADTLQRLGVPATVSTCGLAAELSPWLIEDAVARVRDAPGVRAVGCNCTAPEHVLEVIDRCRSAAPGLAVVVYPNDGRVWDGLARTWAVGGDCSSVAASSRSIISCASESSIT